MSKDDNNSDDESKDVEDPCPHCGDEISGMPHYDPYHDDTFCSVDCAVDEHEIKDNEESIAREDKDEG